MNLNRRYEFLLSEYPGSDSSIYLKIHTDPRFSSYFDALHKF